jgi:hypothetical protein
VSATVRLKADTDDQFQQCPAEPDLVGAAPEGGVTSDSGSARRYRTLSTLRLKAA